jgi:hypothetical protein
MRSVLSHPLAILGMTIVVGYALCAIALNIAVDTDRVRAWLEPRASEFLNRPVTVGGARVAVLPRPSIHVTEVRIDNLSGFDGPALASAQRVRLDVALLPVLIGRVRVARVHFDDPRIYLAIDENGTSNYGDLVPAREDGGTPPAAPLDLSRTEVVVSNASLSYFDAPEARSFTIEGGEARVTLDSDGVAGWRAEVVAESDSIFARVASLTQDILRIAGPTGTLTLHSDGTGRSMDIEEGSVELGGESLALSGRIAGLTGPRPSYDLQLTNASLDAGVLVALLPARIRSDLLPLLDGEMGVTFQLTGARGSGQRPLVRGAIRFAGVGVHLKGQVVVDRLHGVVGVSPDTIVLDSLTGVFAEGPFELSGAIARATGAISVMATAHPDLDALDRLGLIPESTTLSGDADVDLSFVGRLDALDSVEVAGSVTVTGLQAKHIRLGVPLYVPSGQLSLAGRDVSWTELGVLIGEDRVVTTGGVSGVGPRRGEGEVTEFRASVAGQRLDLGAVLPAAQGAPEATYGQIAFAHLGGRTIEGNSAPQLIEDMGLSRPRSLPVRGTLTMDFDTLDFRDYRLESLSATVEFSDSTLVVEAPSFTMWGGEAAAALTLGVGLDRDEPFTFAVRAEGIDAEDFLAATTPTGQTISGTLTVDFDLAGLMDTALLPVGHDLAGTISASITDGRLSRSGPNLVVADFLGSEDWTEIPFETWTTEIEWVNRRFEIRESDLEGEEGRVAVAGLLHLDGSHDLSIGLSIPADRLSAVSLRRTGIGQSVLEQLANAGRSLDLGLRMSGVLWTPVLEPDASNAVASAR